MKSLFLTSAGALGFLMLAPSAFADEPALQDVIVVTGQRSTTATEQAIAPAQAPMAGPDITQLAARLPGAARIGNGPFSGQMQYRGMFGERLNLRVDGQRFASGGPNLMDPVFHYAPGPLVARIVVDRGASPVSAGPGLGGGADAIFKRIEFAETADTVLGYDLSVGARSVDESYAAGGVVGAATDQWRFNLLGAYEHGGDTEFPGGAIASSQFERGVYGLSGGVRLGDHTLSLDARRQNTGPSGNPPFPMDIIYFDTDFARLGYAGELGGVRAEASVSYADVSHLMNNFEERPSPGAMAERETFADATTVGADAALIFAAFGGDLRVGVDGQEAKHNVTITNPNNATFVIDNLPDITMRRLGGYAEWRGPLGPLRGELGGRVDRYESDAGLASAGAAVPMGVHNLANAFNAADRNWDDTTWDAVARLWTPENNGLSWRFTLARKNQAPSYLQRYGWLPTNASGGLADGNIYVGDLNLRPETATIVEAGFDYRGERAYVRPTIYLREVDNFIQGAPYDATPGVLDTPQEMIASMNGDPTPLRFANVDARLYGFDVDMGYDLAGPLRLDAVLSAVRGERRDISDDLYRIAPASLTLDLTWESERWFGTLEARAVAEQDRVSATNDEQETPGYVVLNLFGAFDVAPGVRFAAGIENLLDHTYRDHLAGYNRITGSDVALGARLPGAGRGAFIRVELRN